MAISEFPIPLADRCKSFSSLWNKAKQKQSEAAVHDFRVVARRLLAALELAKALVPQPKVDKLMRRIQKSLKASSTLRDAAVQRKIVEQFENADRYETFRKFLLDKEGREAKQAGKKLTGKTRDRICRAIDRLERKLRDAVSMQDKKVVRRKLENAIKKESAPLLQKVRSGFQYTNAKTLHRTRIGIKRLRYMLEIVHPRRDVGKLRALQKEMGHIHDLGLLETGVGKWAKRADSLDNGNVAKLQGAIRRRRKQAVSSLKKTLL